MSDAIGRVIRFESLPTKKRSPHDSAFHLAFGYAGIDSFRGTMKDLDGMQGTWNLVSAMEDGETLPEDKVKQTTIVVEGDTFRFPGLAEDATARTGTFQLDETKNPKEMDSTSTEKEVTLGIYEMEADSYKVCFAPAGKPRPTKFTSEPGSGKILQVWERQKKN